MNPVICPQCRTRTGIHVDENDWFCCVCGLEYVEGWLND